MGCGKSDIANQSSVIHSVDSDVNDDRPGFDPFAGHQVRRAYGNHKNVGLANLRFKDCARRELVARNCCAASDQQFQQHRPADMVADTNYHCSGAAHGSVRIGKQGGYSARRARAKAELTEREMADIFRMEAVNILARVDAMDQIAGVPVSGQRQLNKDAVDFRVRIQLVDQFRQLLLAGIRRKVVIKSLNSDFAAGLALVAYIHGRCRIFADQDDGQSRARMARSHPRFNAYGQVVQQSLGDAFAIEDTGGHGGPWHGVGAARVLHVEHNSRGGRLTRRCPLPQLSPKQSLFRHMTNATEFESAAFRRLLKHLDERRDVQNIDLMTLAGFCRNCLADWYREAAEQAGVAMDKDAARLAIYGMPFAEWKKKFQSEASAEQLAAFEAAQKKHP